MHLTPDLGKQRKSHPPPRRRRRRRRPYGSPVPPSKPRNSSASLRGFYRIRRNPRAELAAAGSAMGANADPSGSLGGPHRHPSPAAAALQHGVAASTAAALRHDPGLAVRWSPEEQTALDEGLARNAADAAIVRYAKIAMSLPDKTVRDVALRCRWMAKKESSKKRKEELAKKSKEKKERVGDSSTKGPAHLAARPNAPPYSLPVLPMDDDDVSYKAIGGPTGQLLEHNAQILNQIYANISNMQVQENFSLLCQTRDNILAVLKEISDIPEIMKQMPPLPVKLNEDLANSMLPRPPHT